MFVKHSFLKEAMNESWLKKDPHKISEHIKKRICIWINSSKATKFLKITLPISFLKNPAYDIVVYLAHYRQFKKSGLQNKFRVAAFLTNSLKHLIINVFNTFNFTNKKLGCLCSSALILGTRPPKYCKTKCNTII